MAAVAIVPYPDSCAEYQKGHESSQRRGKSVLKATADQVGTVASQRCVRASPAYRLRVLSLIHVEARGTGLHCDRPLRVSDPVDSAARQGPRRPHTRRRKPASRCCARRVKCPVAEGQRDGHMAQEHGASAGGRNCGVRQVQSKIMVCGRGVWRARDAWGRS